MCCILNHGPDELIWENVWTEKTKGKQAVAGLPWSDWTEARGPVKVTERDWPVRREANREEPRDGSTSRRREWMTLPDAAKRSSRAG